MSFSPCAKCNRFVTVKRGIQQLTQRACLRWCMGPYTKKELAAQRAARERSLVRLIKRRKETARTDRLRKLRTNGA